MNQNSEEKDRDNLSMEEYLKRRQVVRAREMTQLPVQAEYSVSALKLAAVFYLSAGGC